MTGASTIDQRICPSEKLATQKITKPCAVKNMQISTNCKISRVSLGVQMFLRTLFVCLIWLTPISEAFADGKAYVFSLTGDGSATLVFEESGTTAYIHDGGRAGQKGVAGATIEGKPILQFLKEKLITDLVISCSHPHDDHMGGLLTLMSAPDIRTFSKITFVDAIATEAKTRDGKAIGRLHDHYQEKWGSAGPPPAIFERSAINADGFGDLPSASKAVRVRNYKYDPAKIGDDPHDNSVIVEYELTDSKGTKRVVVDFDDASSRLIDDWANSKPARKANALLMAHHGSRYNDMQSVLRNAKTIGLTDIIFTTNEGNRFLHPTPEALNWALGAVGADHVHITGSVRDDAIEINAAGDLIRGQKGATRGRLRAVVAGRIAAAENEMAVSTSTARLLKLKRDVDGLTALADKYFSSPQKSRISESGVGAFMTALAQSHSDEDSSNWLGGINKPDSPNPDAPPGSPSSPGSGGPPPTHGEPAPSRAKPSVEARSPSRYSSYRRVSSSRFGIRFGGIILGNEPKGADIASLGFLSSTTSPDSVTVKVEFEGGKVGMFGPVSKTQLWAAYNYVTPTSHLKKRFSGIPIEPDAGGLVGMTGNNPFSASWSFAINPAIADTDLALDAMRLDMSVAAARDEETEDLPPQVRKLRWSDIGKYKTYQWFDEPALISLVNGRVDILNARDGSSCLMRLKTLKERDASSAPIADNISDSAPALKAALQAQSERYKKLLGEAPTEAQLAMWREREKRQLAGAQAVDKEIAKLSETERLSKKDVEQIRRLVTTRIRHEAGKLEEQIVASEVTNPMCNTLPFLSRINILAKLIALFHRYLDSGNVDMPALAGNFLPKFKDVNAQMSFDSVWRDFERAK